MKKTITILSLLVVAALLVGSLEGCKGPTGPVGPGGDTVTVFANLEGFKDGIDCGDCHNPDTDSTYNVWAKKYQWELSKHYFGGDFERNSSTCAGCHTTEGYVQRQLAGNPQMNASGSWDPVTSHVDASPPGCFACHSPHSNGNFMLRDMDPIMLTSGVANVANAQFNYGKGNLCASCHQPRTINPKPDPSKTAMTDTITISNNRWYPHYGVQSQMLMGTGGFQFAGYSYSNSNHTDNAVLKDEGCIACHMADATAGSGIAGGHTMNIGYAGPHGEENTLITGCTIPGCHNATGFTVDHIGAAAVLSGGLGGQSAVKAYLDTLETLLLDPDVVNKWNVGAQKPWIVVSEEGVTINAGSGSNALKIRPASKAGALFNFLFVEHDLSEGVHNTLYTLQLLKSSVEELRKSQ